MTDQKIIAVVGGTGSQGGGLARAILDDPQGPFAARVLTRNPDSTAAKTFAARGAEVVRTDLDDEMSLQAAFDGAYGAFVVTNHWEQRPPEEVARRTAARMELDQAENAAVAARATGLRHVVWSTFEDTRPHFTHLGIDVPTLDEGYKVSHFDNKAEANGFFTDLAVPTTFLTPSFFYELLLGGRRPQRESDGVLALKLPIGDGTIALVAAEDVGRTAYGIFRAGARLIGATVALAGTRATGVQIADALGRALGERVDFRPYTFEGMRTSGDPRAHEAANMYRFFTEAADAFLGPRDPAAIRATLNPRLQTLDDWLAGHRDELKAALA